MTNHYEYAISDVRFISHGITLPKQLKIGQIYPVLEINTGILYYYSVCGQIYFGRGYQTELAPLFTPVSMPFCQKLKTKNKN